jgi:predicted O-methyltransferase YrrM
MLVNEINLALAVKNEKELLAKLRVEATSKKIPIIDYETGTVLELICFIKKPKNILEIGCGTGYSSYFIIKNLGNDSSYTGLDLNKERLAIAQEFLKSTFPEKPGGKIQFYAGNALKIIPTLNQKFDMVFIDAAKHEYLQYIKSLLDKLEKNAFVIADNIFYDGKIFMENTSKHDTNSIKGIKEYIDFITSSSYFQSHFLDLGDGIAVSLYTPLEDF